MEDCCTSRLIPRDINANRNSQLLSREIYHRVDIYILIFSIALSKVPETRITPLDNRIILFGRILDTLTLVDVSLSLPSGIDIAANRGYAKKGE